MDKTKTQKEPKRQKKQKQKKPTHKQKIQIYSESKGAEFMTRPHKSWT